MVKVCLQVDRQKGADKLGALSASRCSLYHVIMAVRIKSDFPSSNYNSEWDVNTVYKWKNC